LADVVSIKKRSQMMSGIRSMNTRPELIVRRALHKKGFRFRLHPSGLPGKPDIVLPKYKAVVFTHGCFWHGHDCALFKMPSTNRTFWKNKIDRNILNDKRVLNLLKEKGYRILIVWECALKGRGKISPEKLENDMLAWFGSKKSFNQIRGRV